MSRALLGKCLRHNQHTPPLTPAQRRERILTADWDALGDGLKRERVIFEQDGKCISCDLNEWLGEPIPLEIEHKDGNNSNDKRSNLEARCPNCHALTPTWRGRNQRNPRKKPSERIADEILIEALRIKPNIGQALRSVGLKPFGNNYKRARKLLRKLARSQVA